MRQLRFLHLMEMSLRFFFFLNLISFIDNSVDISDSCFDGSFIGRQSEVWCVEEGVLSSTWRFEQSLLLRCGCIWVLHTHCTCHWLTKEAAWMLQLAVSSEDDGSHQATVDSIHLSGSHNTDVVLIRQMAHLGPSQSSSIMVRQ